MDATRIGNAIRPEPISPMEKITGASDPSGLRAWAAVSVDMCSGSATCNADAATITDSEITTATRVPAFDSLE